jgi:hypothetical protein
MAQFTPGVTGLALLAFLGAGESQAYGPHKEAVARGIAYLTSIQDSEGRVGPSRGGETFFHEASNGFLGGSRTPTDGLMYNHAIATIALCESYMLSGDERTKAAAAKAAEFTVRAKNPYLAWRYNFPPDGDNDTSVTGWMCWAIATAHAAEIEVERSAIKEALDWIGKMTEPEFGRTGYQQRGGPPGRLASMLSKFPSDKSESLTAMGVFVRVLGRRTPKDDEFIVKSADLVVKKLPRWDVDSGRIDFYYWFWGSAAMRQVGGDHWKRWSEALKEALLGAQRAEKNRDERGSFDPVDCWSPAGGRVYSTALCCMSLESFWRTDRLGNWK